MLGAAANDVTAHPAGRAAAHATANAQAGLPASVSTVKVGWMMSRRRAPVAQEEDAPFHVTIKAEEAIIRERRRFGERMLLTRASSGCRKATPDRPPTSTFADRPPWAGLDSGLCALEDATAEVGRYDSRSRRTIP